MVLMFEKKSADNKFLKLSEIDYFPAGTELRDTSFHLRGCFGACGFRFIGCVLGLVCADSFELRWESNYIYIYILSWRLQLILHNSSSEEEDNSHSTEIRHCFLCENSSFETPVCHIYVMAQNLIPRHTRCRAASRTLLAFLIKVVFHNNAWSSNNW